jgi:uncharacterized protein (TIGR00730 family)
MHDNFPKAYERTRFMNSAEARSLRILSEYLEPLHRFNDERIWHTIVFFGSARFVDQERAETVLQEARKSGADSAALKRAEAQLEMARYYEDARQLARMVTEWSHELPADNQFVVASGGGGGIMEAANRGASEANGKTVSLNIHLPHEQKPNDWAQEQLTFNFHYFFMRKFWFIYRAKASIIFPGGFGTLDELMELLTLIQTERVEKKIPVIIYGSDFWNRVINIQALADFGTISPEDLDLFRFADTPAEAMSQLKDAFTIA